MQAIGPIIRLENDDDLRPIRLFLHWYVNDETRIVHHIPSKLTFVIDYSPPAAQGWVKASELTARLAHVCDGNAPPPPDRVRRIGKEAIHAFFMLAEVCRDPKYDDWIPF